MTTPEFDLWIYQADFEESLIAKLQADEFQNKKIRRKQLEEEGYILTKDEAKQLQKDVSKWKAQVSADGKAGPAFHGTLLNLQKYCRLMHVTPNEALSPIGDVIVSPNELHYFTLDGIQSLLCAIRKDLEGFKSSISDWPVLLPIKYSPRCFVTMHLKIEEKENDPNDLYIRFLVCDYNDVTFDDENYADLVPISGDFFHLREKDPAATIQKRYNEANDEFKRVLHQALAGGDFILATDLSLFLGDTKSSIDGHFFTVFSPSEDDPTLVEMSDELIPVADQVSNYVPSYIGNYGER